MPEEGKKAALYLAGGEELHSIGYIIEERRKRKKISSQNIKREDYRFIEGGERRVLFLEKGGRDPLHLP